MEINNSLFVTEFDRKTLILKVRKSFHLQFMLTISDKKTNISCHFKLSWLCHSKGVNLVTCKSLPLYDTEETNQWNKLSFESLFNFEWFDFLID